MSQQASLNIAGSGPKILIVDDDAAILDSTKMLLEDEGYTVKTAPKGITVPDVVKWQPDLIMLDVLMAGHDGRTICRRLKSTDSTKNIPIIFVSANRRTQQFAEESGADGFIFKPFDVGDLLAIIAKNT